MSRRVLGFSGNLRIRSDGLIAEAFARPPADFTCERCWLEPATVPAPQNSGLTWVCGSCLDVLGDTTAVADAVNGGGRSDRPRRTKTDV